MSMDMECFGLQHMVRTREDAAALLRRAVEDGKRVPAWSGAYYNLHYDCLQIIANCEEDPETGRPEILSGHTHCAGTALWQCRVLQELAPPPGSSGMDRRLLVAPAEGGSMTVVDIMNAEILPSYAPGEIIEMQVIMKTEEAGFYRGMEGDHNAKALEEANLPVLEGRRMWDGCPMPVGYLRGMRENRNSPSGADTGGESRVWLRATIEGKGWFTSDLPGKYGQTMERQLPDCKVMTDYGKLYVMLNSLYSHKTAPGVRSSFLGSLQGDVMVGSYEDGMVTDPMNGLMALRYAFSSGRVKRLRTVMAEGCSVVSETGRTAAAGAREAAGYLENRYGEILARGGGTYALYGVTEGRGGEKPERCVVAGAGPEHRGNDLLRVFADFDAEGRIRRVRLESCRDSGILKYRSWLEMEEDCLVRQGISPAILKKEKAFADFLNREPPFDAMTDVAFSMLDENAVLEFGARRYEGRERVLEYLEGVSRAAASAAGFRARPVYMSVNPDLDFLCRPEDTARAVALFSKLDKEHAGCFFQFRRNEGTGRVDYIRGMGGEDYEHLIDYYGEWDPMPDGVKFRICRRERTE